MYMLPVEQIAQESDGTRIAPPPQRAAGELQPVCPHSQPQRLQRWREPVRAVCLGFCVCKKELGVLAVTILYTAVGHSACTCILAHERVRVHLLHLGEARLIFVCFVCWCLDELYAERLR